MSEKIMIEVGEVYADLHNQYKNQIGEQYNEGLRQQVEDFIHKFNQRVERDRDSVNEEDA